ncbi:putative gustatory receptor 98d [Drosophila teissieri]|uniref:putative gustatory receptor 98d n=1 Tax=Drosophila teissieri TaxID=7243 RepID=UPI001CBA2326|nr:putative gustatory receptor 98d [Drosophila teissieri]
MEANRSRLLTTARPYLQVLALFGLTPPPVFFTRTLRRRRRGLFIAVYGCFIVSISLVVCYECYANIVALQKEVRQFHADDFSKVMGKIQKVLVLVIATCYQLNMLLNCRRLGRIYEGIAALELDVDNASKDFTARRYWWSFRFRLALCIGLWMVLTIGLVPRLTLRRLAFYLHWANKLVTEVILIMLQLKSLEYCLFVLLIYELILRVRHHLKQIHEELQDCSCRNRIQELCVALKTNQLLVGRIWEEVGEIGSYFSLSMALLFFFNGLTIVHVVNWGLIKSINPNDCCQYSRLGVIFVLSSTIFLACLHSEFCTQAYNGIPRILHQIVCLPAAEEYPMLKMGLREYSLQMQHLRLFFRCGGFFNINLNYFGGVVVTIFGYVILLVQFKLQVFAETKYFESNNITEMTD